MRHGPTGKILALSVDIHVLEQRGHCWMGAPHLVGPFLGILGRAPELHVHPVLLRLKLQHRHKLPQLARPGGRTRPGPGQET